MPPRRPRTPCPLAALSRCVRPPIPTGWPSRSAQVEVEILGAFPLGSPGPVGARDVGAGVVGVLPVWELVGRVEVAPQWWVPPPRLPLQVVVPLSVCPPCRDGVLWLVRLVRVPPGSVLVLAGGDRYARGWHRLRVRPSSNRHGRWR
jgi:hypothetical protein